MADNAPRPIVAGNWKMNGLSTSAFAEVRLLCGMLEGVSTGCDVMLCPPATLLHQMSELIEEAPIQLGGQDCHEKPSGAHTGDISAIMLADAGAVAVIVGHSERRTDHGESDETVRLKATAAHAAGLKAIICVGETLAQRDDNETLNVIAAQLAGSVPDASTAEDTVIAYEPVWAIGTGRTPTVDQVAEVHTAIRQNLADRLGSDIADAMAILYGGSVKPSNAEELMSVRNVDGALVGGASLKAADFIGIIKTYT